MSSPGDLVISKTEYTPDVSFGSSTGKLLISGRCMPENPNAFFQSIYSWVEEYVKSQPEKTDFTLFMDYYNSGSARKIVQILFLLENLKRSGKIVRIKWLVLPGDRVMKENGEEFKSAIDLPFSIEETSATS